MSTKQPTVVVVSKGSDLLSKFFSEELHLKNIEVKEISEDILGDVQLSLKREVLTIEGHPIIGILFRAIPSSTFTKNFIDEDQRFCDAEIRATWLAALHLDSILVVNRYDAIAWFEGVNWPVWRRRFIQGGLPVSRFIFGDFNVKGRWSWYPYKYSLPYPPPSKIMCQFMGSALTPYVKRHASLVVCNEIVSGEEKPSAIAASNFLTNKGIQIAKITSDQKGLIVTVDTQPEISEARIAKRAAHVLFRWFYENLHIK